MSLDARRILIFREVARAGSISAAARKLGWTQPAVSQHLARLEREAGGPLLLRGPTGVSLTEAGELLLRRADAVSGELHAAYEEVSGLHQLHGGSVRLVSFPSASATLVPDALVRMAARHAAVDVRLSEGEPPEAIAAVLAGDADLALVFGYEGPPEGLGRLVWRPLLEEAVHLVVPPTVDDVEELAELERADWIAGCERCRRHLVACCDAAGFTPLVRHATDDYVVVQALVARGLGVTTLPATALEAYRHPEVRILEIAGLGRRSVGIAHRPGAETVPATAALIAEIVAARARPAPPGPAAGPAARRPATSARPGTPR